MTEKWTPDVNERIRRETYIADLKAGDPEKYESLLAECDTFKKFETEQQIQAAKTMIEDAVALDAEEAYEIMLSRRTEPTNDQYQNF